MTPDTALGLSIEFKRFLKGDWSILQEPNGFRLTCKEQTLSGQELKAYLRNTAWQLARDLGYRNFVSLSEGTDGRIKIVSRMASGEGFELLIDI
jgi:hypothetical protein